MRKTITSIISVFLIFTMIGTSCVFATDSASAESKDLVKYIDSASQEEINNLPIGDLQNAAKVAKTADQADKVFNALLEKVNSGQLSRSSLINTYVTIVSSYQSNNQIVVNYRINAKVPSGAHVSLGIQYPSSTRIPSDTIDLSSTNVGSYAKIFYPQTIVAKQVFIKFTARDYKETLVDKTFYYNSSSSYDYHTITAAEVFGYFAVYVVAPNVIMDIFPESKLVKYGGITLTYLGIGYKIASALNVTKSLPAPILGQYYQTKTWYSNNKLYTRIKVWTNKSLYDNHETPAYDSGDFVAIYLPSF